MSSTSYHRDLAVCRKILSEGTGIQPARMTGAALDARIRMHMGYLLSNALQANITSAPLARAIVELEELYAELFMRGVQLQLPID